MSSPANVLGPVASVFHELREGLAYIFRHREIAWYTFTKGMWSLGAGVLLLLTLYGREAFPLGRDGALSIGLLYTARGVGAALGPWLAQRLGGQGEPFLRRALGPAIMLTGAAYLGLSAAGWFPLALLAVVVGHMGGSIMWVFSTALLQIGVPDRLRGRVFAVEYAAMTLASALSSAAAGFADDAGVPLGTLTVTLAGLFFASGAVLALVLGRKVGGGVRREA